MSHKHVYKLTSRGCSNIGARFQTLHAHLHWLQSKRPGMPMPMPMPDIMPGCMPIPGNIPPIPVQAWVRSHPNLTISLSIYLSIDRSIDLCIVKYRYKNLYPQQSGFCRHCWGCSTGCSRRGFYSQISSHHKEAHSSPTQTQPQSQDAGMIALM